MKQELHHDGSDALYETVLKLRNTDECRAFFEDICSPHELRTIEQRFQLLFLLTSGPQLFRDRRDHRRFQRHHQPRKPPDC